MKKGQRKAWIVLVRKAGDYSITATVTGGFALIVDDEKVADSKNGTASAKATLVKGIHSNGTVAVASVDVQ